MSVIKQLQRKVALTIYDNRCLAKKADGLLKHLKEAEKTLNNLGKSKKC